MPAKSKFVADLPAPKYRHTRRRVLRRLRVDADRTKPDTRFVALTGFDFDQTAHALHAALSAAGQAALIAERMVPAPTFTAAPISASPR